MKKLLLATAAAVIFAAPAFAQSSLEESIANGIAGAVDAYDRIQTERDMNALEAIVTNTQKATSLAEHLGMTPQTARALTLSTACSIEADDHAAAFLDALMEPALDHGSNGRTTTAAGWAQNFEFIEDVQITEETAFAEKGIDIVTFCNEFDDAASVYAAMVMRGVAETPGDVIDQVTLKMLANDVAKLNGLTVNRDVPAFALSYNAWNEMGLKVPSWAETTPEDPNDPCVIARKRLEQQNALFIEDRLVEAGCAVK